MTGTIPIISPRNQHGSCCSQEEHHRHDDSDNSIITRTTTSSMIELPSSSSPSPPNIVITADTSPSMEQMEKFQKDGYFAYYNRIFSTKTINALNHRLELVLRGEYDTGCKPDKTPKLIKTPITTGVSSSGGHHHTNNFRHHPQETNNSKNALGYSGNKRKKVFQIINIHKSDKLFHDLVTFPLLGKLVAKFMKWEHGARLAQDQIWAKPPGAPPLAYHRDSPYFMFEPNDVATVWIALDDMHPELGPLTYVKSSHRWGDGRIGSSQNFFQDNGGKSLLYSAAKREGIDNVEESLEFQSMAGMQAGGMSIHDGRTWHGSGPNTSDQPRRGIGLHFVPVHVKWTRDAMKSQLWKKYLEDAMSESTPTEDHTTFADGIVVSNQDFPITWTPSMEL